MDAATRAIYEAGSETYEALRRPRLLPRAQAFGALVTRRPAIDLGSGPGWYTAALGTPVVAIDGALAMVRRTREVLPTALLAQADLTALPFRSQSLGGGWARNTYVHLRSVDVPVALADLHRALRVDAPIELTFFVGEREGWDVFPDDDLPGRWFSTWPQERLLDVLAGAGFSVAELEHQDDGAGNIVVTVRGRRERTLPDTVAPGLRLLLCGLNPSLRAADAGVGFVTPGNRFWPAALEADLVTRERDPRHALLAHGIGMTDLVKRATPRAAELRTAEYRAGVERVERLCSWLQPAAICFVGLAGWRAAVDRHAQPGWQTRVLGGTPVYVMPSTSGLNAATPLAVLTDHLRAAFNPPA